MNRLFLLILLATSFAVASDAPSIRVCIGPLENRSSYQLPIDKLKADFASQLNHKNVKALTIAGEDIPAEMAKNRCDYLVRGEFGDEAALHGVVAVDPSGRRIMVDERKHFALRFNFELSKSVDEKPEYARLVTVIDKNPKTCADDEIYEATGSIRDYLKGH